MNCPLRGFEATCKTNTAQSSKGITRKDIMSVEDRLAQFIVSGLTTGSIYALIALGFCIINNATGIVNFTQVDFVCLGVLMLSTFLLIGWLPAPLAFLGSVMAVTAVGAMVERLAIRPAKS